MNANGYEEVVGPEHIELTVKISAEYVGTRISGACLVSDEITLTLPQMDSKYVIFPKVMEGAVSQIIDAHRQKVMAEKSRIEKEKKEKAEREKGLKMGLEWGDK